MKKIILAVVGLILVLAAYLAFWPVPVDPQSWDAPISEGYTGDFAPNTDLADLERISIGETYGPEDVAAIMREDGLKIYTSAHEGDIIEIDPVTLERRVFAKTGGVPLGIEFGADGTLIVADAHKGLLAVDVNGEVTLLTDTVDGTPILYADDVDITPDGVMYFSDASTKFGAKSSGSTMAGSLLELMEHGKTGRILAYDPSSKTTSVVADNYSFSNGVATGPDGQSILVNETGEYRVQRIYVSGPRKGESEIIIDNLPGFPDNINRGPIVDGIGQTYLLGLISKRSEWLDANDKNLGMRKLSMRLPPALRTKAQDYGFIVQITAKGEVLKTWQDPSGDYPQATGAIIAPDGFMYVSSLSAKTLARKALD
ncbi:MAG: SMP-30/gluconolactonase/LRE family protein [Maricaulaceae bacterium]